MEKSEHGRLLSRAMTMKNVDRTEVAVALGVSPRTITNWRNGHSAPDERQIEELKDLLGDYLTPGRPATVDHDEQIRPINDADPVDQALLNFQHAVSELVRAEQLLDNRMRQWAIREVIGEKVRQALVEQERKVGRPLTHEEITQVEVPRPTPAEIAECIAWEAVHDPREWTRYEMALVEHVFPDRPGEVQAGSNYADLAPARDRVRRIAPKVDLPPIRLERVDESEVPDGIREMRAAAERGTIEEPGSD